MLLSTSTSGGGSQRKIALGVLPRELHRSILQRKRFCSAEYDVSSVQRAAAVLRTSRFSCLLACCCSGKFTSCGDGQLLLAAYAITAYARPVQRDLRVAFHTPRYSTSMQSFCLYVRLFVCRIRNSSIYLGLFINKQ